MKIIAILALLFTTIITCQNNNYYHIPDYDCKMSSDKKFRTSKEILFVFPNNKDSSTYIEWTKNWKKGFKRFGVEPIIKFENELTAGDFNKTMLVLGTINSFQTWNRFETPIKQIPHGFEFAEKKFSKSDNAIFYLSDTTAKAMRLVITGNSISSLRPITNNMRTGYNYLIFENGIIIHYGNCTDNKYNKSKHVFLPDLKSRFYKKVKTKYYDFYISTRLENQIPFYKERLDSFDLSIDKFISKMQLKKTTYRIPCFIHYDQEEISYISTFFNDLCQGKTYGRVNGKEIHSTGFDGAIEHESEHLIFDSEYNDYASTFFGEGIRQYYEYLINETKLSEGFKIANEFANEDMKPIILGYEDFFQGNKYYLISGIFVKYLIDNWSLNRFKHFYKSNNIENGFKETFNIELDMALINYKEWLKKK